MFLFVLFCFFFSQFLFHRYWLAKSALFIFFFAECKVGYFKDKLGNTECTECPLNSVTETVERKYCKCKRGFFRAAWEKITDNCTGRTETLYLWNEILMVRQSDIGPLFPDNCYFVFIPPSLVTLASFETNVYIVCPVFLWVDCCCHGC